MIRNRSETQLVLCTLRVPLFVARAALWPENQVKSESFERKKYLWCIGAMYNLGDTIWEKILAPKWQNVLIDELMNKYNVG